MDLETKPTPKIFQLPVHQIRPGILRFFAYLIKVPLEYLSGLRALERIYAQALRMPPGIAFCERVLQAVGVRRQYDESKLAALPTEGPVVVVANHPFGGIEGVILLALLRKIRPDVKAMANYLLGVIPEMREDFILVDPFGNANASKANLRPMKESIAWLQQGHLLIVFPAGEVSSFDRRARRVRDIAWSKSVASLIRRTAATVVPIYFDGHNGWRFQLAGLVHPRLRTLLLPRHFANKKGHMLNLHLGTPLTPKLLASHLETDEGLIKYLRFRTYLLAERKVYRSRRFITLHPPMLPQEPIVAAVPPAALAAEVGRLPESAHLISSGDLAVFVAAAAEIPAILREIGRLREITFRAVGEGTGNAIDLDEFDNYYYHLFMWHRERQEVIGSYRLGLTDKIMAEVGVKGLYTRTLFKFDEELLKALPPAIEMGRSFIRVEYQKAYTSLFLLWKGISMFVGVNPHYRVLFGPVSITNEYREASRCMILAAMRQSEMATALIHLVHPQSPPKPPRRAEWSLPEYDYLFGDVDQVAGFVAEIEPDGKDIPVLLRQYLRLGGKMLAFNVDFTFSSVVDGLIVVDLTLSGAKTLRRYMGAEMATNYLKKHNVVV